MAEEDITGSFFEFQKLCVEIEDENSYNGKTKIVENFLKKWKGDVYLLCRLLLARDDPRVYNLREKAFAKVLSRILGCNLKDVLEDFEKGDMSETSKKFFEEYGKPQKKSTLTLKQVDAFLNSLLGVTKEDDQVRLFTEIFKKCTSNDLKYLWKIIDHDLKINIGPKFVLAALHPKAFDAYMKSNDLRQIIDRVINHTLDQKLKEDKNANKEEGEKKAGLSTDLTLMIPVKPMLAKATKTAEDVIKRCPNTAYGEVKYDGERIQVHKQGKNFTFYSRNLKPILPWKVEGVKEYIPKSTDAKDIILDGEILLMDTQKRKPLPFGTLGIHKKNQFQEATVCVFFFDILYLDGKTLTSEPMEKRRQLLEENVKVIPNRIELSEYTMIKKAEDVTKLMARCIREGLEGLVIKDLKSIYEPNARHWLKMKKDYLKGMADSADLLVLGAYFGTGNKGGLMSVFLMGVYDKETDTYKTVCKVGNGHDDDTINRLQKELKMVKIQQDYSKVPAWLDVHKIHTPDFVATDPKKAQVWEIEGAEFSASNHHTAANISIRFPRVVKIRDDKDWSTATNLEELKQLAAASTRANPHREADEEDEEKEAEEEEEEESSSKKKKKAPAKPKKAEVSNNNNNNNNAGAVKPAKPAKKELKKEKEVPAPVVDEMEEDVDLNQPDANFHSVAGDVTKPVEGELANKIILNLCTPSGKWSNKGVFAALSKAFGETLQKEYDSAHKRLGGLCHITVKKTDTETWYVSNIIALEDKTLAFNMDAFKKSMKDLCQYAIGKRASVNLPKFNNPGLDWNAIEKQLRLHLSQQGIPVYVYTFSKTTAKKRPAEAEPQQPKEASKEKKQKVEAKPKQEPQDEDAMDEDLPLPLAPVQPAVNANNNNNTNKDNKEAMDYDTEEVDDLTIGVESETPLEKEYFLVFDDSINPDRLKQLKQKAKELGAVIHDKWQIAGQRSTHLICSRPTENCKHVRRLGGTVLREEWIEQIYSQKRLIQEKPYLYRGGNEPAPQDPSSPQRPPRFELPSYFDGLSIVIHKPSEMTENLKRYIIAYAGEVVEDHKEATHVVTEADWDESIDEMLTENKKLRVVTTQWAWSCINKKGLQPEKHYLVKKASK